MTRGLEKAKALITERGSPAQLCVYAHGRVVVDESFGCPADSQFILFSAGKPLVALAVHLLAQRGALSLDDPVAARWPEFGQRGKQDITIRQVLQHRGGLPVARGMPIDALVMTDWHTSIRAIERAVPAYPPGEVVAYHILTFGFILGEVVRRVTGIAVREFVAGELLGRLGVTDVHVGLPASLWDRHVPVSGRGPTERLTQLMINRRATREAVIPAASVSATATGLAALYQALLSGGRGVLSPETIAAATRPSSDGEIDRYLHLPIRWSQGFQLGGERPGSAVGGGFAPMGSLSSRSTFGHNGSYVCLAWADPERQMVMAYLTSRLVSRSAGARHMSDVSDAVLTEFS